MYMGNKMKTPEELAEEHAFNIFQERYESLESEDRHVYAEAINDFLAGYQAAAPKWISVKDKLPEEGKHILWCHEPTQEMAVGDLVRADIEPYFTHWMPLPKPPTDKA